MLFALNRTSWVVQHSPPNNFSNDYIENEINTTGTKTADKVVGH